MDELRITLRTAPTDCWSCGAETTIISSIHLRAANDEAECSVSDFTGHPALIQDLSPAIAGLGNMGEIKPRFSKTLAKPYMSNGCAHCDALFGQHFELMTRYDEHNAAHLKVPASGEWGDFLCKLIASEDGHLFHF